VFILWGGGLKLAALRKQKLALCGAIHTILIQYLKESLPENLRIDERTIWKWILEKWFVHM
jgi:hypothetical protein